jgi:hypothetical protein
MISDIEGTILFRFSEGETDLLGTAASSEGAGPGVSCDVLRRPGRGEMVESEAVRCA